MHFLLLLGLIGPTFIQAASPFKPFPGGLKRRLVVFGDSTNDIGSELRECCWEPAVF